IHRLLLTLRLRQPGSTLFPYTTLFRSPRVARREQHAGVHVAGTVVLRGGSGGEGPRVEEHLRWAAGLGFGHNELRRLLYARKRRSEEHTSELQSRSDLVCRLLLEKKKR